MADSSVGGCCGYHKVLRTKSQSQRKEFKLKLEENSRLKKPRTLLLNQIFLRSSAPSLGFPHPFGQAGGCGGFALRAHYDTNCHELHTMLFSAIALAAASMTAGNAVGTSRMPLRIWTPSGVKVSVTPNSRSATSTCRRTRRGLMSPSRSFVLQ